MKNSIFLILALVTSIAISAQSATTGKIPEVDKSPLDISYFPSEYPMLKIQNKATEPPIARVIYSRPAKSGRTIFGDLIEYGQIWRLGANEATEIEFYKDVKIGGKKLAKGRYTMYAIPDTGKWTMVFNKETDVWGAFKYDPKKDALRTEVAAQNTTEVAEYLVMYFAASQSANTKTPKTFNLVVAWDNVKVTLPCSL